MNMTELDPRVANFEEQLEADLVSAESKAAGKTFYFAVPKIEAQFVMKTDLKKYLESKGLANYQIIKGRALETRSKTVVKIDIL